MFNLSEIIENRIFDPTAYLTDKEVNQLSRTSKKLNLIFSARIKKKGVHKLLNHIAKGRTNAAEKILKKNPDFLLAKGNVTDYSKRFFKNIKGLQYALWALDKHMWTMIMKYLSKEQARQQLEEHESINNGPDYVQDHGRYYDFSQIIDLYQNYFDNSDSWTLEQRIKYCTATIGTAQKMVPAHVANEYCRPDIMFYQTPTFNEKKLPRLSLYIPNIDSDEVELEFWFTSAPGIRWQIIPTRFELFMLTFWRLFLFFDRRVICSPIFSQSAVPELEEALNELETLEKLSSVRAADLVKLKNELNRDEVSSKCFKFFR